MIKTILVIDDSRIMREMVASSLKTTSFNIITATDGVDAVAPLGCHALFDLIITDLTMPGLDLGGDASLLGVL